MLPGKRLQMNLTNYAEERGLLTIETMTVRNTHVISLETIETMLNHQIISIIKSLNNK